MKDPSSFSRLLLLSNNENKKHGTKNVEAGTVEGRRSKHENGSLHNTLYTPWVLLNRVAIDLMFFIVLTRQKVAENERTFATRFQFVLYDLKYTVSLSSRRLPICTLE